MQDDGIVVHGITAAEAAKYETLFRLLDAEGNGIISEHELADLMPRMGVFLSEEELHSLFCSVDADGSGGIEFPEFLILMSRHREANQLALLDGRDSYRHLTSASKLNHVIRSDDVISWVCDIVVLATILFYIGTVLYDDVTQRLSSPMLKLAASGILLLDIVRGLFTSTPSGGTDTLPIDNAKVVRQQYFRSSRFAVDVIAGFPLDALFAAIGQPLVARIVQHLRLVKIVVVPALFKPSARDTLSPAYARFHFSYVPLLKICFWACIAVHILSILWIVISPESTPYIDAVYFVVYTLTTTGYGDIAVVTLQQKLFAITLFCFASVVTGLVVGKLVQFSQQADLQTDSYRRMLETLAALDHLTIPRDFKEEVLAFQLHRLKHSNSLFNDAMSGLPQVMQERMALYARMKIVRQVPIFGEAQEICVAKLAQSLINVFVPPEEYLVIAGEEGEEMFFLFHGMCAVWLPTGKWIATIKRGGVFGEVALLQETRRSASIKSLTYCQLFRLDKGDFSSIVAQFPDLLVGIQAMSVALQKTMAKQPETKAAEKEPDNDPHASFSPVKEASDFIINDETSSRDKRIHQYQRSEGRLDRGSDETGTRPRVSFVDSCHEVGVSCVDEAGTPMVEEEFLSLSQRELAPGDSGELLSALEEFAEDAPPRRSPRHKSEGKLDDDDGNNNNCNSNGRRHSSWQSPRMRRQQRSVADVDPGLPHPKLTALHDELDAIVSALETAPIAAASRPPFLSPPPSRGQPVMAAASALLQLRKPGNQKAPS